MKFDAAGGIPKGKDSFPGRREVLGLAEGEKMLLAASTHPGEEEIILSAYKSLLGVHPELRLLIAPRHPERSAEVCRIVEGAGFLPVRISSLDRQTERPLPAQRNYGQAGADRKTVFILDTIGEMVDYYAICDIAFVGGSLVKKGGHNILEPAAFAKPIICGTQMFNFRDIAELFVSSGAFKLVRGEKEFREAVACFLEDPQAARLTGERARQLLEHNRGATLRTAEAIREYFIP
jgi:3-deoxy-D-manno-octulosonic-acid transferase